MNHPENPRHSRPLTVACTLLAALIYQTSAAGPVKIFVMAGQSNTQGHGEISPSTTPGTLSYITTPANDPQSKYQFLKDGANWVERNDVFIHYQRNVPLGSGVREGGLTVGYGANSANVTIGPELGFGHVLGDLHGDKILLIKTCWGGKSLGNDFLPPSSENYPAPQVEGDKGFFYQKILEIVNSVTTNIAAHVPGYAGEGYVISGFAWHQGWNDRVTPAYSAAYQTNMANFINDIRDDLETPDMPFVIATTGMDGGPAYTTVEQAQLKMADTSTYPEFEGNVRVVDCRAIYDGLEFWQAAALSPSSQGYHWNRNAKTYLHIGMAMGDAMSFMVKPSGPYRLRATGGVPGVTLNWQNGTEIPTSVQVLRNGVEIAAAAPADPPAFIDSTATPGVHDYQLVFTMPVTPSAPLDVTFDGGITGLSAFRIPGGVYLTWANNLGYPAIEVRRDDVLIESSLSGTATTFVDASPPASGLVTYSVVPGTGTSTPATVQINLSAAPSGNAVIYEPFDYPVGGLNGNGGAEVGLAGTWTATTANIASGSLAYGSLPTYGNSIGNLGGSSNNFGGSRLITAAALSGSGLLNDGATLWFSMVMGYGTGANLTNARLAFALANSSFSGGNGQYYIVNEGSQPGSGLGVTLGRFSSNGWTVATQFRDGSFGTSLFAGNVFGTIGGATIGAVQQRLVIGKITWGECGDTLELYQPDTSLNLGPAVSTLTVDVDQSTFDTITFTRGDVVTLDEIRFGANLEDVIGASTPAAYWDLDDAAPGAGGLDGNKPTGTWDTGNHWNPVFTGTANTAAWSAGNKAVFSAGTNASGAYTVTIDGTRDIGGLAVEEGTTTLTGGTALRLTKSATVDVKSGLTTSIATSLTEDAAGRGLSKEGSGTLQLSTGNGYSGPTNLFNGVLHASAPTSLPGYNSAAKVVFKGGTLGVSVGGGWTSGQVDTLLANATKSSGSLGIDTMAGDMAQWTPFTGVLGLSKLGSNTFTLDQANTFSGVTTVQGGTLALANNLALQNSILMTDVGGAITMSGMGTPTFGGICGSGNLDFVLGGYSGVSSLKLNPQAGKLAIYKGIIADGVAPMPLHMSGAGTQVLQGANSYEGTTTVSSGTLAVGGSDGSIADSAGIVLDGGRLLLDSAIGGNANRIKDSANVTLSLGGELALTGAAGSLTETCANVNITGNSTLSVKQGTAGAVVTLEASSFTRTGKATALVRGTALGQNTTQMGKLTFDDPGGLSYVGSSILNNAGNSDASKTVRIIPYFLGGSTDMEAGSTFITHDTALGLRALNTTNQFTTLAAAYVTPGTHENVKGFNGTITAADPSFNSLLFNAANQTLAGSGTLTIDSGTIASVANNEIISGFSGVTLGNGVWNEGVIHVTGSQLLINPPVSVTAGGGLTKGGSSLLILAAPVYQGDTTVNAGTLQVNTANANNNASAVRIWNGARFVLNFAGTDTVQKLIIGNTRVPNGIYSRTSADSTALGIGAYFGTTGNGTLTVSDNVAPTIVGTDIVDDQNGGPVSVNILVSYTVTFSEEMDASTITAADFGNAGNSTVSIGAVTQIAPAVFLVPVTPTSTGTLQLRINTGADLRDFVNNPLNTTPAILDDTTITVNANASPTYQTWSGGAPADGDANNDGVANGVAWALGAADPNANAIGLLPTLDNTSDPTYVRFTFNRSDAAEADASTDITVQYGSDLVGWTTAVDDNDNVEIEVTDGSPNDAVVVKLKRSTLATGGRIFVRLSVVVSP